MLLSINQPCYLPWCGLIERIARADLHVHLDDVQFIRRSFFARNRVLDPAGREVLLAVPVHAHRQSTFTGIGLAHEAWRRRHLTALRQCYRRMPLNEHFWEVLTELYARPYANLADLSIAFTAAILAELGVKTPIHRSSELGVPGKADDRLVTLCQHFGATAYYASFNSRNYIRPALFAQAGIQLTFQNYQAEPYPQGSHQVFVANLSVLDVLLRHGAEQARTCVMAGAREPFSPGSAALAMGDRGPDSGRHRPPAA